MDTKNNSKKGIKVYIKELGVFMSKSDYEDYKLTEAQSICREQIDPLLSGKY